MHPQQSKPSIWRMVLVVAGPFVAAYLLVPILIYTSLWWFNRPASQIDFDATVWQSSNQDTRGRMHKDLVGSGQLHGRTKDEVVGMLGPDCDCRESDGRVLSYRLGVERNTLFPVDGAWLLLYFDEDGMFQRHLAATD
jgi:hypothetical protein